MPGMQELNPRSRTLWHQTKKFPQVPCLLKRNNSRKMSYDITQSSYLEFGPNEAIFICSHYNQLDNEHLILFSFSSLIFHYLILAGHLPVKLFVFISSSQHLLRGESKIRLTSHFFFSLRPVWTIFLHLTLIRALTNQPGSKGNAPSIQNYQNHVPLLRTSTSPS